MSVQGEFHDLVRNTLKADSAVMALVTDVFDSVSDDPSRWGTKAAYISFGPADVVDDDADCITAGTHTLQLDCWSRKQGSYYCKLLVDAVKDALHEIEASLADYGLVELRVIMRRAFADPDGLTWHGVVMVEAMIEERVL